jgi:hypothetical protein
VSGCPPTVNVSRVRVTATAVLLAVTTNESAIVTVGGRGLTTVRRKLAAGVHLLKVPLRSADRRGQRELRIRVSATNAQGSTSKIMSVKRRRNGRRGT